MGLRRPPRLQDARGPHHPGRGDGHHDRHRHELDRGRAQRVHGHADRGPRLVGHLRPPLRARARTSRDEERRRRKGLTEREVEAIAARCPPCTAIAPLELPARRHHQVRQREACRTRQLVGTTAGLRDRARRLRRAAAASSPTTDVSRGAQVAVIGADIADALFPLRRSRRQGDQHRRPPLPRHRRAWSSKGKFLFFNRDNLILRAAGLDRASATRASTSWSPTSRPRSPAQMEHAIEQMREIAAPPAQAEVPAEGQLRDLHPGHAHRPLHAAHAAASTW